MTDRTATQLAQAMRDAYRPDGPVQFTIEPGDNKAIAGLELLAMWLKESAQEREEFNRWRKRRRERE